MERFVSSFLRFVAGRGPDKGDLHVNRIAMGRSHDRALAAFKAEQARVASRQEGGSFASKRSKARTGDRLA